MTWALVLFLYVGADPHPQATLRTGFTSEAACERAARGAARRWHGRAQWYCGEVASHG